MHFKSGRFFCFMQSARENQGHEHGTRMHGPFACRTRMPRSAARFFFFLFSFRDR